MRQKFVLASFVAVLALAAACADESKAPLSPSDGSGTTDASTETLKVSAPTPIAPLNDAQPTLLTLEATAAESKFAAISGLQYNFEVYDSANVRVVNDIADGRSHTVATPLDFGKRYTWRVRGTKDGAFGPFSTTASFIAPAGGYNVAGELYDPLVNGRSIGTVHGNVEFIPGVGAKFLDNNAYIDYALPATIAAGEISAVVANVCTCSGQPGVKTKVFAMSEGYDDITVNERRFTVEKRSGSDKGVIAWRVLAHGGDADTVGAERVRVEFGDSLDPTVAYLFRATYDTAFNLTIDRLGGERMYEFGKDFGGGYTPSPHIAFLGSPPPRGGPDSGTLANMIVRHFWISSRQRPDAITK